MKMKIMTTLFVLLFIWMTAGQPDIQAQTTPQTGTQPNAQTNTQPNPQPNPTAQAPMSELEKVFRGQVLVNMSIASISSPLSTDFLAWVPQGDWIHADKAVSIFVMVYISPELIDAAVEYWAEQNKTLAAQAKEDARNKLKEYFIKDGEKPFFLLTAPIRNAKYPDYWGLDIGPLSKNMKLEKIGGETGNVIIAEKTMDDTLYATPNVATALIYMQDPKPQRSFPVFNVTIDNVFYTIKSEKNLWLKSKKKRKLFFRFESDAVKLLGMIKNGVTWDSIEQTIIQPSQIYNTEVLGSHLSKHFSDIASDLTVSFLLKQV